MNNHFKKTLDIVRTAIYLIMCMLFTSMIYVYFSEIFLKSSKSWPFGIFIVIFIVLTDYFCRLKITNLILFFVIHIALMAATVLIPGEALDKVILTFIAGAFLLMAINFWRTETQERSKIVIDVPFAGIVVFILIYFHSSYFLSSSLSTFAYIGGIIYFLLFFIRDYLDKLFSYSLSSENFSQEMRTIFSTNISLIGLFNIAVVFLIITVNMFFSDSSFNIIGKILRWIARRFFGFLEGFDNTGEIGESETPPITIPGTENAEPIKVHTSSPTNGFNVGTFLFNVLQIVIFIGLIIGVLFIIYSFIKQYMHRNHKSTDEIKQTDDDVIEKVKIKKKDTTRRQTLFLSNQEKIRKIFTKKVDTYTKNNQRIILRKSFTPTQISDSVIREETAQKENMSALTRLYEKARYSDKEITKEDVEQAKRLQ